MARAESQGALLAGALLVALAASGEPPTTCTVAPLVPAGATRVAARLGESPEAAALLEQAGSMLQEGRIARARALLVPLRADAGRSPVDRALAASYLAVAQSADGEIGESLRTAEEALAMVAANAPPLAAAAVALNAAVAFAEGGATRATRAALELAARKAHAGGDAYLEAAANVDLALLVAHIGGNPLADAQRARSALASVADPAIRSGLEVSLGLALVPEARGDGTTAGDALAAAVLADAYHDASAARQVREMAHALGLAGELRLLRGDARGALAPLERAVALSRAARDDPWRYRWLWKLGAARALLGDDAGARRALEESVTELEIAKSRRMLGRFSSGSLARNYRGVYLALADLLLAPGAAGREPLREARDVMERSRTAEVEDYFRDPCIASSSLRTADIDALDASVAVLYPIVLAGRTEILVGHRSGLARFASPHGSVAVAREAQRLRVAVEQPDDDTYRVPARRLDEWLVAPVAAHLARLGVKTLVWVPDGALRGVPFAALFDGKRHLIERYAIAVTPVASLTDPRPFATSSRRAVLSGLTQAREGFDALPGVGDELARLSVLLKAPVLKDEAFTVAALQETLERAPASVIHVASHGQFAADATQTFLLAYDGHFTLPLLRRALAAGKLREEPVELLTLSACQTAAGDERAALGLAGVALSAGARSALATLWSVNDESTALLIADFYRRLVESGASKSDALQGAQLVLLRGGKFSHPAYWAPFLLIGNWM